MISEVDLEQARFNMIEQQVRPWEVLDGRVLSLLEEVPRDRFVPEAYRNLAYADIGIPLGENGGEGRQMMHPNVEARMLQALQIKATDSVLEIGTGSGYVTALLAHDASHVLSIEVDEALSQAARGRLDEQRIANAELVVGDGARGWDAQAPYDVIAITGSLPMLPESFQYALKPGGRLFAIVGDEPIMEAVLITRVGENQWRHESLFETNIAPLVNAEQPQRFEF